MAEQRVILGLKCKAYCGPEGLTFEQLVIPANEMTLLRSATLNLTKATADVTTRGSTWRLTQGTLKEASVEGEIIMVAGARDSTMFSNAFLQDMNLSMFISDGYGKGLFGDFSVNNLSQSQPLEDVVVANYTVAPTLTDRFPEWVETDVGLSPLITSSPEFVGAAGSSVSFALTASPAATSWSAANLPDGLTIASATGIISGTVAESGVFWPYVTATNSAGSTTRMLQIVIEE